MPSIHNNDVNDCVNNNTAAKTAIDLEIKKEYDVSVKNYRSTVIK